MNEGGDVGQGVRMVLAATVSAVVVAALTIVVGQRLIDAPSGPAPTRSVSVISASR